jgi:hypothetical protein
LGWFESYDETAPQNSSGAPTPGKNDVAFVTRGEVARGCERKLKAR